MYVLGKNILGKNVTDRLFPVAKTLAKGMGQVGEGLSTFGELLPAVKFDGGSSPFVIDEEDYEIQQQHQLQTQQRVVQEAGSSQAPKCTTPAGGSGRCTDIQNCPILLADLEVLRKSV